MLRVHLVKNFSRIEKSFTQKNNNKIKQKGNNLLKSSLLALSILGLSSINSCTKDLNLEKEQKTKQIDSTIIKKEEKTGFDIIIDDSLNIIEDTIVI